MLRELARGSRCGRTSIRRQFDGVGHRLLSTSTAASCGLSRVGLSVSMRPTVDGQDLSLEGRVGVAHFPDHGVNEATLLQRARGALHEAERATTRWASATSVTSAAENRGRLETLTALRAALTNGELCLHYQPIVGTAGHELHELEALSWSARTYPPAESSAADRSGPSPAPDCVVDEALRRSRELDEGSASNLVNVIARPRPASR